MESRRVMVLGASGMLGSAVLAAFGTAPGIRLMGTTRDGGPPSAVTNAEFARFDVGSVALDEVLIDFGPGDYVINCIGLIKQHMEDTDAASRETAVRVNSALPYAIAAAAERQGFHLIQIATDCVFSGRSGGYTESDPHDALDVYGKSKSLGEVPSASVLNVRTSIIGRELKTHASLMDWVLAHPHGATLYGFTDHRWNGVTTDAFARVCVGLVSHGSTANGTHHLVPADSVTKDELVRLITRSFGRDDLVVEPRATGHPIDRTLATTDPGSNDELWAYGGFERPPTIAEMVSQTAADWN